MQLDIMGHAGPLKGVGEFAAAVERAGFANLWFTESGRTAYLSSAAAALATDRLGIGTAVAVAFPRSPMVTAQIAWELAEATEGRFTLGLGTQVKAHVERRYSADFKPPGPRMKEYVQAVKTIFAAFQGDAKLQFEGDYFNFSLLPPQWTPGPIACPAPPVYVSAVLPWMCAMAGEVCDGVHVHPFHSVEYLEQRVVANAAKGAARTGRDLAEVTFEVPVLSAVGDTDEELQVGRDHSRTMIAFYGSTPAYAPIFELHGYDDIGPRLSQLQREGDIPAMVGMITDDVLDHFSVTSSWADLATVLHNRYAGIAPNLRLMSYSANTMLKRDPDVLDRWSQVVTELADLSLGTTPLGSES
jgi:probable F420-dependent oxidoreductase